MKKKNNEIKTTAHSTYRCQYHIVFAPKFRRQEIYGALKKDIGEILRKLCDQKKVEIIEAEACKDHIHMLVSIPPYLSISQFMGYLKGKSSLMIFDRHANLKYKYGSRHFWCRGYYVDTLGRNKKVIAEYIKNQLAEYLAGKSGAFCLIVPRFRLFGRLLRDWARRSDWIGCRFIRNIRHLDRATVILAVMPCAGTGCTDYGEMITSHKCIFSDPCCPIGDIYRRKACTISKNPFSEYCHFIRDID